MKISKELLLEIGNIDEWLKQYYNGMEQTKKEDIYARSIKLNEEVGELMSEVLASFSGQRKSKLKQNSGNNNLKKEFGDVLLTTLLLAKSMDVDINEALELTINKVKKRFDED